MFASENPNSILIIDELKGRRIAKQMGVNITGTLGVLVVAKKKGYIEEIKPLISRIEKTNFRISKPLIKKVLSEAGEL